MGRSGRRDGNALNMVLATARPHDLQFWEDLTPMLAGQVKPPGVFLAAEAVLLRQVSPREWAQISELLPGKAGDPGRTGSDNRLFVNGCLWVLRSGAHWKDLTDALGNLVRFELLPGHRFDTVGVAPLLDGVCLGGLIADKAFDSNAIIADLNARGAKVVISQHPRRANPIPIDAEMYKGRHLIEFFFCELKEFKRIAIRADKTDTSFSAIIHLAAAVINSR